jgi:hypothetical protein
MDAQTFLDNFAAIADAPGGVQRLRDLVLDLAFRGRLVEHDPTEGEGHALIREIAEQRSLVVSRARALSGRSATEISPTFSVPSSWAWAAMRDLHTKMGAGSTPKGGQRVYVDSGVAFLRSQNVWNDGLRLDGVARIPEAIHERMAGTAVRPRDVLLNITGASIGRSCIVASNFDEAANVSQHVAILRQVDPATGPWVHLFLISPHGFREIMKEQVGISREGLSMKRLGEFAVPVPPLPEQARIIAKVDELMRLCGEVDVRRGRRHLATARLRGSALHALADAESPDDFRRAWERITANWPALTDNPDCIPDLRRSILDLALGGRMRPTATRGKWTECLFGDQITLQRGFDITKSQQRPGPYPVVSSGGVLSRHAEPACTGPGVVIGRKGSVGRVHWVPGDYWPHDTTLWVKDFHGNEPEYVYWFLRNFPLLEYENSTANPSLNRNRLHPVAVLWPTPDMQGELVEHIRRAFDLCDRLDSTMRRRDRVGSSLSQALLYVGDANPSL